MKKNNGILIIIFSTLIFGVLNRGLVGTPYIVIGDFSITFLASLLLWWGYDSILFFVAYQCKNDEQNRVPILKVIVYGALATIIKVVIDTCIDMTVGRQPNVLFLVAAVEMSMILYIMLLDAFLFLKIRRRKIKKEKKGVGALIIAVCSLLIVYTCILFYYMNQVKYAVEQFGAMPKIQELGLDNAIWNLTTTLSRRSMTIGMIVYVGCFILIWCIMDKITIEKEPPNM